MESEPNIVKPENELGPPLSVSGVAGSQAQVIELLHPSEQQKYNDSYEEFEVVRCVEENGQILIPLNHLSLVQSSLGESILFSNNNEATQAWTMSKSPQMQPLKFPDQVLALTQAAANANGHPEKYLSGWPFLSPYNLQMLKCEKCSQEFCSAVNHRRHFRGHRQFLIVEKDSMKNRDFLAAYWDKLPSDEAREISSLKNASIEDVDGILITSTLASFIRSPGFSLLPQIYLKAGASLLDIVGGTPSRFPLSSKQLFSILDDASEMTFLCGGTALSLQKYIFGRDAGRIALEMKNLISCTSFMIELELVKAWIAHKDVEALRCQQLLMEEEETSRRRQAEFLEKKKLKKLRQKEKRVKESTHVALSSISAGLNHGVDLTTSSLGSSPTICSNQFLETQVSLGQESTTTEKAVLATCLLFENADQCVGTETSNDIANGEIHLSQPKPVNNIQSDQDESEKSSMVLANGINALPPEADPEPMYSIQSDQDAEKSSISLVNGLNVLSLQEQLDRVDDLNDKGRGSDERRVAHGCSINDVMIGSISIKIGGCDDWTKENILLKEKSSEERPDKNKSDANVDYCPARKFSSSMQFESAPLHGKIESKKDQYYEVPTDDISRNSCLSSGELHDKDSGHSKDPRLALETANLSPLALSSRIVKAFLAKRWKEIMAEAHVTLSLRKGNEESLDGHENNGADCREAPKEQPDDY